MAGLQASTGLISGIDIQGVVDSLIEIEAATMNNLQTRQDRLNNQQAALLKLTDLFNTSTYMIRNLGKVDVFTRRVPQSSNESVLKVSRTSNPAPGNYQFTPLQLAQSQTTLSDGVASDKTALGKEGEISIKFGRDLETNYSLGDLNGGYGFDRGYIRITDATGARANIDLRTAQTMNDILEAINSCTDIDVTAEMEEDHIKLTDYSGGDGTLRVQEVNNGTTAASLGLIGTDVKNENNVITGLNLLYLGADMSLDLLNDGNGLSINTLLQDLTIKLSNGNVHHIDFSVFPTSTAEGTDPQEFTLTVGDLMAAFNDVAAAASKTADGKAQFELKYRKDGKGFELIDNTTGAGKLTISQHEYNPATQNGILYQLGFADYGVDAVEFTTNTATGRAVLGDMDSVLLSSLNGGRGFSMDSIFENVDDDGVAIMGAKDRDGNYTYITVNRAEFDSCDTLADLTRLLNGKLEKAVLYEEGTSDRIPLKNEDGTLKYVTYDNGAIKYELNLVDKFDLLMDISLITNKQTDVLGTDASWIYSTSDPTKVIGYRDEDCEYFYEFEKVKQTVPSVDENGDSIMDGNGDPVLVEIEVETDTIVKLFVRASERDYEINADVQGSFTNGNLPVLKKDGTIDSVTVPQEWDGDTSKMSLKDTDTEKNRTFIDYIYTQSSETGAYNITGYTYSYISAADVDNPDAVPKTDGRVTFATTEIDFLSTNGFGYNPSATDADTPKTLETAKRPILSNDEILTSTTVKVTDVTIDYLNSDGYGFNVDWKYDGDPDDPASKVIGYTLKRYDVADPNTPDETMAKVAADTIAQLQEKYDDGEMPLFSATGGLKVNRYAMTVDGTYYYPELDKDGNIVYEQDPNAPPEDPDRQRIKPRFTDGATPPNIITIADFNDANFDEIGLKWVYKDDDPSKEVIGYILGDETYKEFTVEEKTQIAESLDGGKYPLFKLTTAYEYKEAKINLKFQMNADKTGLELVDTSDAKSGDIMFGDLPGYGGHISSMLGFGNGVEADAKRIVGGDLHLQTVSMNTKISDMNGGSGVNLTGASIMIVDSSTTVDASGRKVGQATISLEDCETLGDIINKINRVSNLGVLARINAAGDGITLEDVTNPPGTGSFSVTLTGGEDKNVLKQLGIGEGTSKNTFTTGENNTSTLTTRASITGSTKYTVEIEKTDSLDKIREKINELGIGVQATVINDGSGKPFRLSIAGSSSGAAGTFKTDFSALGLGSTTMSKAQDAVLLYGDPNSTSSLLVSSSSNTFTGVVPGISMTINSTSKEPISVWTETSSADIKASLNAFVTNYNNFRDLYNELTLVNINEGTKGLLAMDSTILRLGSDMSELLLQIFNPNGPVRCLQDLGISITPVTTTEEGDVVDQYSGKIAFDEATFDLMYESNPEAIQDFFARQQDTLDDKGEVVKKYIGYAAKWENLYHQYSYYEGSSTLNAKYDSMQTQIEKNEERLLYLQERLDFKREYLLQKFYAMEAALASMQGDSEAVAKLSSNSSTTS